MLAQQKLEIVALFQAALAPVLAAHTAETGTDLVPAVVLERPRDPAHGDIACNIAMQLAKQLKMNPRELATRIVAAVLADPAAKGLVEAADVAGPGFINLRALLASDWLAGMRDYVVLTLPTPIPDNAQHRSVRRVQVKSSPERLRRRLMRRHDIDEQTARQRIPDDSARFTQLPFLQLRSTSTGQTFRLFIEHGPIQPNAVSGDFNAYGLSQGATIPWF